MFHASYFLGLHGQKGFGNKERITVMRYKPV